MRRIVIFILFITAGLFRVQAQTYPVQATTQLMPPYSLYLADYVNAGNERLALNVYLADIARPSLDVRFRLRIVGQGVTLETKAEYRPAPVSLQGGVPLRLISTDLAEYFNPNNLNFQGMSRQEYNRAGKLPEGAYQFCFEVLEYNRGVKISNTACAMAWLILNDPPIINLPANGAKLKAQDPQNVLLQWTPRHTGSPNAAFSTEYDVRMVEIWPATRNPNDAILSSPPIFETTTTNTTVIYGPAETPLEPGRRYAFRVRARSMVGLDEMDLFKNRGYSEVFTFVYGDPCDLPTGITAASISPTRFSLSWQTMFSHTAYRVRYREVGTTNWYENNVTLNSSEITGLKPGTPYEYQVAANCGFFSGQYSEIARVTTAETPEAEYACGVPLETFKLDPAALAGSLKVGDIIQAGDFDVKLTKVSGSNGVFTGEGIIEVPYFNKAKVNTQFSSITVSKELRMVNGYLNVTGAAVDVIPEGVTKFIEDLNEILDVADSALDKIEENLPEQFDPHSFVPDTLIVVKDGIQAVYPNPDGSVSVIDKNGDVKTLPAGTTAAIVDETGKGYLVDSKGKVHPVSSDVAAKAGNRQLNLSLTFTRNIDTRYGLDRKPHPALESDYEELKGGYPVLWKSVAAGETDAVTAVLGDATIDRSQIKFEMGNSPVPASPAEGQSMKVLIQGLSEGEQGLLATYAATDTGKVQVLGKLNVATYAKIKHDVIVVPVNMDGLPYGMTDQFIQDSLNATYGQGVVSWAVTVHSSLQVSLSGAFDDGGTGLLTNYTGDMKKVIHAYGSLDDDKYYLFLIPGSKSGLTQGYMPRGKSAGFIFVNTNPDKNVMVRTMAHELAHGAFNLHHIFDEPNFKITKGATDNLMDYPAGPRLYKFQWDKMRFPDIVIGLFEEDDDAALMAQVAEVGDPAEESGLTSDCYKSSYFMAPNGKLFEIKDYDGIYIAKASGQRLQYLYFVDIIKGKDGKLYKAEMDAKGVFTDYKTSSGETFKGITYVPSASQARVVLDYGDLCYYKFHCIPNWQTPPVDTPVNKVREMIYDLIANDPGFGRPWKGRTSESPECQSILYVLDATDHALPGSVYEKMKAMFDGDHENVLTGEKVRMKGRLILTSSDPSMNKTVVTVKNENGVDVIYFGNDPVDVPADEVLFWLESKGDKILVKRIVFGEYISTQMQAGVAAWESGVTWNQKDFWEKSAALGYMAIDGYFTALYDLTDLLASGIGHLQVPESIYDCKNPKYNPFYAKVFMMVNITTLFQTVIFNKVLEKYPNMVTELGGTADQIQFAMFCGMYNGVIDVVKSVPEFVHMLLTPFSSKGRDDAMKKIGGFMEIEITKLNGKDTVIICAKDEYLCKVWELVSSGIVDMFTKGGGCKVAHNIGAIVGPILVMCIGDEAAAESVIARIGGNMVKVIKWCDNFTDAFRYLNFKTRLFKDVAGKLMLRITDGMGEAIAQLADGAFMVRVYLKNGAFRHVRLEEFELIPVLNQGMNGGWFDMTIDGIKQQVLLFAKKMENRLEVAAKSMNIHPSTLQSFKNAGLSERTINDMLAGIKRTEGLGRLITLFETLPFKGDAAAMRALANDIAESPSLLKAIDAGEFDAALWKTLKDNDCKLVRRSAEDMAKFAKLKPEVQKYIAMFVDAGDSPSTLQQFLKAIDNDPKFLKFVNNPKNERFVRGFVSHKAAFTKADAIDVAELIAEEGLPDVVVTWLERSKGFMNFSRYKKLGNSFGKKVFASLKTQKGPLYDILKKKLNMPDVNGKSMLDQYKIFEEVRMAAGDGYMKADVMLVRWDEAGEIADVIVIENKLSKGTGYTERQVEGFSAIGGEQAMTVHSTSTLKELPSGTTLKIPKEKCFRLGDHGTDDISRVTDADVDVVDYKKLAATVATE